MYSILLLEIVIFVTKVESYIIKEITEIIVALKCIYKEQDIVIVVRLLVSNAYKSITYDFPEA